MTSAGDDEFDGDEMVCFWLEADCIVMRFFFTVDWDEFPPDRRFLSCQVVVSSLEALVNVV